MSQSQEIRGGHATLPRSLVHVQRISTRGPEVGKRGTPAVNLDAAAQGGSTRQRLFVRDRVSRNNFLIDTGAEVSAITPQPDDTCKGPSKYAVAANGSPIAVFGARECTVDLRSGSVSSGPLSSLR